MKVVAFDVKGAIAHFRKPDTTATQLTYPFISPTAAKGMVGAILGIEDFTTKDLVGIQLLSGVEMVSQQLSMLGKGGGTVFNRPTTIQLLVQPAYRIYYGGTEYVSKLETFLKKGKSVYPTYLGAAYALTTPVYVNSWNADAFDNKGDFVTSKAAVPVEVIQELDIVEGYYYQRANGFMHKYLGNRTFEKSLDYIFEKDGKEVRFKVRKERSDFKDIQIVALDGEIVCLA